MTQHDVMAVALRQSARDCNCRAEDFLREENVYVASEPNPGARRYLSLPLVCDIVSYGANAVISGDPALLPVIRACVEGMEAPCRAFETPGVYALNRVLEPAGARVCFMADYFLPDLGAVESARADCAFDLRVLQREALSGLYSSQWHNALSFGSPELNVLAVGTYAGDALVGLAGCSADCEDMWQIGVDVLPGFRHRGVAAAMTNRLAREILARGKVPFYCAAWSNVPSVRNAIRAGFRPGWVEITAKPNAFIESMDRPRA